MIRDWDTMYPNDYDLDKLKHQVWDLSDGPDFEQWLETEMERYYDENTAD